MNIISIAINLEGKYSLANLASLGFKQFADTRWRFNGKVHRYIFDPIDNDAVRVIIAEKPGSNHGLPHQITFGQIKDWVGKCVDTIEIGPIKRSSRKQ
jgi:hypothetical protein